jgi:hypothetical protein
MIAIVSGGADAPKTIKPIPIRVRAGMHQLAVSPFHRLHAA